jgi:hypothetical protein
VHVVEGKDERREAWYEGVLRCGRQHSCPVCGERRCAQRAAELTRMMREDFGGPGWRMITLTLRHRAGQPLVELIDALMRAWRRTRSTRAVRDIFRRKVSATARALEVTWSARNGWHPHIHLLVRSAPWSDAERRTLEQAWLARAPGLAGVAVKWSNTPAHYLAKLGAEVASIGKVAAAGHYNGWQLARAALKDDRMVPVWREYQAALHGRRILELDERAKALAARCAEPAEPEHEWMIPMYSEEYSALAALERRDAGVLWLLLEAAMAGPDPPAQLRAALDDWLTAAAA